MRCVMYWSRWDSWAVAASTESETEAAIVSAGLK